jgi:hypothetical protein
MVQCQHEYLHKTLLFLSGNRASPSDEPVYSHTSAFLARPMTMNNMVGGISRSVIASQGAIGYRMVADVGKDKKNKRDWHAVEDVETGLTLVTLTMRVVKGKETTDRIKQAKAATADQDDDVFLKSPAAQRSVADELEDMLNGLGLQDAEDEGGADDHDNTGTGTTTGAGAGGLSARAEEFQPGQAAPADLVSVEELEAYDALHSASDSESDDDDDLDNVIDVWEDKGGGREELKLQPGDIVWVSTLPSASLPSIPTPWVAEASITAALHNLPQQLVAQHGCVLHHPREPIVSAPCTCKVTAGAAIGDYPTLSSSPMLMNHLWVEPEPARLTSPGNTGILSEDAVLNRNFTKLSAFVARPEDEEPAPTLLNVPLPSLAMPLEATVLALAGNEVKMQVQMPKALAEQWFGSITDTYHTHARPHPLTPSVVNGLVGSSIKHAGDVLYTDTHHHPVALSTCLTLGKHHVAANSLYPVHASKQTEYVHHHVA